MNSRHAYLITAYDDFYTLKCLMRLLDDARNDIYLHVDKKSKDFDERVFTSVCLHATVTIAERQNVYWGHYSQIESILRLHRLAQEKGSYSYVHLVSGSDLPLKTQDEIHAFFDTHHGKQFVGFSGRDRGEWVNYIHMAQRFQRSDSHFLRAGSAKARSMILAAQRRRSTDSTQGTGVTIAHGSDWYSVTGEFARHLVAQEALVKDLFRWARVPTEFYVQTVLLRSRFADDVFDLANEGRSTMRFIDWSESEGSGPRVLREADLPALEQAERLFGRKFSAKVDRRAVDALVERVSTRKDSMG